MSTYTKHTWQSGDAVTAAKINNMEDGIETAFNDINYDIRKQLYAINKTVIDLNLYPTQKGYLYTDKTWRVTSSITNYRHICIPIIPNSGQIQVVANTGNNSQIGFLNTYPATIENQLAVDYCDSCPDRFVIGQNKTMTVTIPDDCNYLVINTAGNSTNVTPQSITFIGQIRNQLTNIINTVNGSSGWPVPICAGMISTSTNNWLSDPTGSYYVCLPITNNDYISIKANSTENTYYALLTNDAMHTNQTPGYCENTTLSSIAAGETYIFDGNEHILPSSVRFLYIACEKSSSGGPIIYEPTSVSINWIEQHYSIRPKIDNIESEIDNINNHLTTLDNKIPEYTGTDGYYILQAYKENDTVTYSWVPKT